MAAIPNTITQIGGSPWARPTLALLDFASAQPNLRSPMSDRLIAAMGRSYVLTPVGAAHGRDTQYHHPNRRIAMASTNIGAVGLR